MSKKFGPKKADHPSCGELCPACKKPFKEGDYTTLINIGPGDDPEEQGKMREGRAYNSVAIEAHWACVTGEAEEVQPTFKLDGELEVDVRRGVLYFHSIKYGITHLRICGLDLPKMFNERYQIDLTLVDGEYSAAVTSISSRE